ncbi:MAG: GNAT family N-acetyltransferase [Defluviitaleaceae bacterium]|nr:GNAT family N-acetyltransferase [Defluviitaleaceae bacterium]
MTYKIDKIDTGNISGQMLDELFALDSAMAEKYGFLKRIRNAGELKESYSAIFASEDNELFVIKNDEISCGILTFLKAADWNGNLQYKLYIRLSGAPNQHLVADLEQFANEKISKYGQIAIITYNNELPQLIEKYAAKVHLNANAYTLSKSDINTHLLDETIAGLGAKNADLNMVYTDIISEEYIERYCDLFMKAAEDMTDEQEEAYVRYIITPEIQRRQNENGAKRGQIHHCYMVFDGDIMAAKTNLSVNKNDSRFPYQFMVAVSREYRGRGLGKWLYAHMYKMLFETTDFEKVLIMHHPKNKAIIDISLWAGYKFAYSEVTHLVEFKA